MIPQALAPLTHFRQFITYKLTASTRPGKLDKLPVDWRTGQVADAHNPEIWTDYDTAYACGDGRVGFVFTEKDPFWFLDIDNCLTPSGWSPLAQEICAALPGAAVEVSQSGKGLHLFGVGTIPPHACKGPTGSGLELYHTGRFVAFGVPETLVGDASADCTAGLAQIVARYFPKSGPADQPLPTWTDTPVAEWRGSSDDEALIQRMLNAKQSAGQAFGQKATLIQLWNKDVEALSKAYPDAFGDRPYDESSADAALAQHLAYWTGKNCERMKRLMLRSQLVRDKWQRDDYLPRTILGAVGFADRVCIDKPLESSNLMTHRPSGPIDVVGDTFVNSEMQKTLFDKCCYIAELNKIIMPGGHIYKKEQFDALMGGFTFAMDLTNEKVTRSPWECFTMSQAVRFDKAHTCSFRPDKEPGSLWMQGNERHVNTYWPINMPMKKGNAKPFLEHLAKLLPAKQDQDIMLAYMAAVVQYRGVKFQWCPLIQGVEGNGKTLLSRCIIEAVGHKHCHSPKSNEIVEKYNDWTENKIFISIEDIYVPHEKRETMEILKPMITNDYLEIRSMGRDKVTKYICCNFMLNSNHKDAIKSSKNDRRYAVFFTDQQAVGDLTRCGMAGDYFPNLYSWLRRDGYAIVADYLLHYPIPDALNPAKDCQRAPSTTSTAEALRESQGTLEQEIDAAILEGKIGFRGGWISSHYLDLLLRDLGGGFKIARNKRRDILIEMGYIAHPALAKGQVNNPVQPDACKPVLFVKADHWSLAATAAEVSKGYTRDQLEDNVFRIVAQAA